MIGTFDQIWNVYQHSLFFINFFFKFPEIIENIKGTGSFVKFNDKKINVMRTTPTEKVNLFYDLIFICVRQSTMKCFGLKDECSYIKEYATMLSNNTRG